MSQHTSAAPDNTGTDNTATDSTGTDSISLDQASAGTVLPTLGYDVSATTVVLGALASRDWRPMHHDYKFATERNGNTRHFPQHPQPGRLVRAFHHRLDRSPGPYRSNDLPYARSVYPDDHMVFAGTVSGTEIDESGCGWAGIDISVTVGDRLCCTCTARVALPTDRTDNPWARKSEDWKP